MNLKVRFAAGVILVIVMCVTLSGCQLLALPAQIIGGTFDLLGKALQVADALPKPPPGLFF